MHMFELVFGHVLVYVYTYFDMNLINNMYNTYNILFCETKEVHYQRPILSRAESGLPKKSQSWEVRAVQT